MAFQKSGSTYAAVVENAISCDDFHFSPVEKAISTAGFQKSEDKFLSNEYLSPSATKDDTSRTSIWLNLVTSAFAFLSTRSYFMASQMRDCLFLGEGGSKSGNRARRRCQNMWAGDTMLPNRATLHGLICF